MLSLYIVCAWFIGICYSFVLISSAAGQNNDVSLFHPGESLVYQLHSTVHLNEKNESSKNVGFYVNANVIVSSIWSGGEQRILKLELKSPQLYIRSRKAPSPDGFVEHSSNLDKFTSKPFYLVWHEGNIDGILLHKEEPSPLANLKRGIASLFQFHWTNRESNETDASGRCDARYQIIDSTKFKKTKTNCMFSDLPFRRRIDPILDVIVISSRQTTYEFDQNFQYLQSIEAKESHYLSLAAKETLGSFVTVTQTLDYEKKMKGELIEATFNEVIQVLEQANVQTSLVTEKEELVEEVKSFQNLVNEHRDSLAASHLGTIGSAKAFTRLLDVARRASKNEITKVLGIKKNKNILPQIYDIMGYVQTESGHEAVMKKLHFDEEDNLELSERYLWALSMAPNPNPIIIKNILDKYKKNINYPDKVKETMILALASMANRISLTNPEERKVIFNVEEAIVNGLNYVKGEERYVFLRALKNLKSARTINVLIDTIKSGSLKEAVLAFKALKAMDPSLRDSRILKLARNSFLQLNKKYDSSSRTLAVDIILEQEPSDDLLLDFLHYLKSNDTSFEVKQYVMQRLQMMADENPQFKSRLLHFIKTDPTLNNYSTLSPKGLSTALKRSFLESASANGSLLTIQEIFGGIVKRGIVNVMMDKNHTTKEMFSLGIFAGGLSSFMGGETEGHDEVATAGMELTILENQIRPFVFFNGQGELMGHVWSGTASERTTAFQSLILLQDHLQYIRLGSGFIAELYLQGAMSFDLSGKIEISIWGRTADSIVEKSAGIVTIGSIKIDSSFIRSQVEFSATIEPKLHLQSNIDFSGNMVLCMRVTQPDSTFRHNIFKIERIPGSKHKIRIAKYKKVLIPGTTYSLNKKNNEMCSAMFS